MKRLVLATLLVCAGFNAGAQSIYRCGNEYRREPCASGKMLESSDPRTAAQRAEATRVAARERKQAADMARERRAEEAPAKPAQAAASEPGGGTKSAKAGKARGIKFATLPSAKKTGKKR